MYTDWFNSSDLLLPLDVIQDLSEIHEKKNYVLDESNYYRLTINQQELDLLIYKANNEQKEELQKVKNYIPQLHNRLKIGFPIETKEDLFDRINLLLLI